jgi:hypothetical protein
MFANSLELLFRVLEARDQQRRDHCGNQQPSEQPPNNFGLFGFERPIQSKLFVLLVPGGGVEPP